MKGKAIFKKRDRMINKFIESAKYIGSEAMRRIVKARLRGSPEIKFKKEYSDIVTPLDIFAESSIKNFLKKEFPDVPFFGEETGGEMKKEGLIFYIDPLDGTTNMRAGINYFSISLALAKDNIPVAGVIITPPLERNGNLDNKSPNIFYGAKNIGAWYNNTQIYTTNETDARKVLLITGFPSVRKKENFEIIAANLLRTYRALYYFSDIRRYGSAALDLCAVASGKVGGYFEYTGGPWDIAAGLAIVQAAGGIVVTENSNKFMGLFPHRPVLVAANKVILNKMQEVLYPSDWESKLKDFLKFGVVSQND